MTSAAPSARALFDALCRRIDAGQWWPADTRFEIVVGAVLTQNVAWRNVEYSLANLREAGLLEAQKLATTASADLQRLIRPSGFMRAKSDPLQRVRRTPLIYSTFSQTHQEMARRGRLRCRPYP